MHRVVIAISFLLVFVTNALAVNPDEILDDPVLEQRARELSVNIRCLVCQNQSIDDSDAHLARDLRILVREKLVEGLTDEEIIDYLVERYGEFVLLKPRFGWHTLLLWGIPFIALLGGFFALFRVFSKPQKSEPTVTVLTKEEQAQLNSILKE